MKRWPIRTPQKIRNRNNTQKTQENEKMTNTYPTKNKKQKEQTKNTGKWKDDQYVPHKK